MLVVCSNMLLDTELQMTGRVDDGPQGEGERLALLYERREPVNG